MRSPINYLGKKTSIIPIIERYIPYKMDTWVDLYFGSGALTLSRSYWAECEIVNDLNCEVVNFFRVLRDKPKRLIEALKLTPHARQEMRESTDIIKSTRSDTMKALYFCIRANQAFSSSGRSNGGWRLPTGGKNIAQEWSNKMDENYLYTLAERLRRVSIENTNAIQVLKQYDHSRAFFYADPPYLSTVDFGTMKKAYQDHVSGDALGLLEHHKELITTCLQSKSMIVISGYDHPVYKALTNAGWNKIKIPVKVGSINKKRIGAGVEQNRTEILWVSPNIKYTQIALL